MNESSGTGTLPLRQGIGLATRTARALLVKAFMAAALIASLQPIAAQACAACYGQSDSALAQGMNWGIASLLVTVVTVLGGLGAFFVFLAKKSAAAATMIETSNNLKT